MLDCNTMVLSFKMLVWWVGVLTFVAPLLGRLVTTTSVLSAMFSVILLEQKHSSTSYESKIIKVYKSSWAYVQER